MRRLKQSGFSLIEMVIALVATSLILAALAPFFARPIEAMIASNEIANATEHTERALARLGAELPTALPNSVRIACAGRCLEFVPVLDQADYRALTPGDRLDFAAADTSFDVLTPLAAAPATGTVVVINNLSAATNGPFSVYSADAVNNRGVVAAGTTGALIRIAAKLFPSPSARQRFYVIGTPVSYLCAPAAGGGTLRRRTGYAMVSVQPVNTAQGDLIASDISDCMFTLNDSRLVSVSLTAIGDAVDPVSLYGQIRLPNEP